MSLALQYKYRTVHTKKSYVEDKGVARSQQGVAVGLQLLEELEKEQGKKGKERASKAPKELQGLLEAVYTNLARYTLGQYPVPPEFVSPPPSEVANKDFYDDHIVTLADDWKVFFV